MPGGSAALLAPLLALLAPLLALPPLAQLLGCDKLGAAVNATAEEPWVDSASLVSASWDPPRLFFCFGGGGGTFDCFRVGGTFASKWLKTSFD